ncbi:ImmA/IrrE family metallo-endopeptidase [Neobacillus sp. OS1-2]|uniref:ImmA/IrrE family metallo-endopeptidase n=1 Tax=Neobacillus sp. OS1-2 TaxID=3070680 RepID=UPI0027DF9AE9|nr:ImmA/IrrE family metallo-endopeptidase [Neobacillus sp. OS1-2]WML38666.1 ImmA/IrrE family metallo-endopeptidase [Neobacillus sp. OS1-2]
MELYKTTALEDWITAFYRRLKIQHPHQIDENRIARIYGITINRWELPSKYLVNGRFRGIYIDIRKPKNKQREIFFHEFCHILRHSGCQTMMPAAFRELQEWDARHFTLYAVIPAHMLKFIDLNDEYVIDQMVSLFKVTPELCEERLEQIKNRRLSYGYVAENQNKYRISNY